MSIRKIFSWSKDCNFCPVGKIKCDVGWTKNDAPAALLLVKVKKESKREVNRKKWRGKEKNTPNYDKVKLHYIYSIVYGILCICAHSTFMLKRKRKTAHVLFICIYIYISRMYLYCFIITTIINIIYGTDFSASVTVIAGRLYKTFMPVILVLRISIRNHLDRSGRAETHWYMHCANDKFEMVWNAIFSLSFYFPLHWNTIFRIWKQFTFSSILFSHF